MQLTEIEYSGQKPVDGYGPGFFRVGGLIHRGALLLLPGVDRIWGGFDEGFPAELIVGAGADRSIDVLLIGCGAEIGAIPASYRAALDAEGIGAEQMATPAACRSYNMLVAEGRRVGLAAFAMPAV